jgi:hypothetical protein
LDLAIINLGKIGNVKAIHPLIELSNVVPYSYRLTKEEFENVYRSLQSIHRRIKPKGYNPKIKKLIDQNDT